MGGSLELIALLLEAQATVDIKDSNGETPVCPLATPRGQSLPLPHPSNANTRWHSFSGLQMRHLFHLHSLLGCWVVLIPRYPDEEAQLTFLA